MKEENLNKAINLYEEIKELRQVMNSDGRVMFAWRSYNESKFYTRLPSELELPILEVVKQHLVKLEKELEEL